jgi:hypothetical protein
MNRSVFAPALASLLSVAISASAFAQAQPAVSTTGTAGAAKAKFLTPLKGEAKIEVIQGASKQVGKEVVKTYKIKNLSSAPIALLKIDEYYYDKGGNLVSTAEQRYRQPFGPGEVIEMTTSAPATPGVVGGRNQAKFSHANGTVNAKAVKKFE